MGPDGAQFNPAIEIKMTFNKANIPAGIKASQLFLAFFDGSNWVKLDSLVDEATNTVAASVSHFTEFAIIAPAPPATPAPAPSPVPTPVPAPQPVKEPEEIVSPAVPQDLTATVLDSGLVFLHWTHNLTTNENGFMIERASDKDFESGEIEFHAADRTESFTDITVAAGNTYFYRVEAVTGVGHSAPSNVVSVTIPSATPTPAPAPVSPETKEPAPPAPAPAPASGSSSSLVTILVAVGAIAVIALVITMVARRKSAPKA
jgi:hypothetical protein